MLYKYSKVHVMFFFIIFIFLGRGGAFLFLFYFNFLYFEGVVNKTVIPLVLVRYEIVIANSCPTRTPGRIV